MKNFLHTLILSALVLTAASATAQTYIKGQTYNITKDMTISGSEFPDQCESCVITISKGVTLTINKEVSVPNTNFSGGTLVLNNKLSTWTANQFTDINVTVNTNGSIASSATMTIKNATFTFLGKSSAAFWASVTLTNSRMKFLDNASMEATSSFNLKSGSSLVAGDGTASSAAFIKFNGGTLNEYDSSYVSLQGTNNYYHNWANYNAGGKSMTTTNNKINCDGTGKNACSAPVVYGPATLNTAGVASSSILPVKLSAFAVKLSGTKVDIAWTTDMEMNADRFEIERSADGINWSLVGTVKATGNTSNVSRYGYVDMLKVSGSLSYRLKMIDSDGSVEYSAIKLVKSEAGVEMNIYPNPATSYVVISAKSGAEQLQVELIGQNGQSLKRAGGAGSVNLSVSEFNTGSYYVRVVDANGAAQSFKLLIKK